MRPLPSVPVLAPQAAALAGLVALATMATAGCSGKLGATDDTGATTDGGGTPGVEPGPTWTTTTTGTAPGTPPARTDSGGSGTTDNAAFPALAAALLPDLAPPPIVAHALDRSTRFWLGGGGTFTRLHCDDVDLLFVQVVGRKRWWLASPAHDALLHHLRGYSRSSTCATLRPA